MDDNMDEDLIVLGAPAETQAAGGETSDATESTVEGHVAGGEDQVVKPGTEQAEPAADAPKPAPKGDGEDDGEAATPKKRSGIQRMQDKIARLEAALAENRSAPTGASEDRKAAIEKEIGAPPKESDFDDYVAFEDAKAEYRIAKALATQRVADREAQTSSRQSQAKEAAVEAFQDRMDEARDAIPDFDKVIGAAKDRTVSSHVGELVIESEKGGLLSYYLAKNPAELDKLNRMSPLQAAKAVGALEHRLTLAKPKKAPSAPAPAKPVAGGAAPSSPDAEIDAYLAKTYGARARASR
ncbi:hypothetical protein MKK70_21240 [Methylobacterium sp. E-041]|uniref:hypothetical protein n=1 Tax=Methylobacterium sp. E-041 TaxID=2836573 RepID=UPI001FBA6E9A|nr:hypothetical protein [Methylobacterium sp. E-041]MCJ2107855.1 hypothetical protein [Methylobacterium sp. E-041]